VDMVSISLETIEIIKLMIVTLGKLLSGRHLIFTTAFNPMNGYFSIIEVFSIIDY
jgi:hypothetical protein